MMSNKYKSHEDIKTELFKITLTLSLLASAREILSKILELGYF